MSEWIPSKFLTDYKGTVPTIKTIEASKLEMLNHVTQFPCTVPNTGDYGYGVYCFDDTEQKNLQGCTPPILTTPDQRAYTGKAGAGANAHANKQKIHLEQDKMTKNMTRAIIFRNQYLTICPISTR